MEPYSKEQYHQHLKGRKKNRRGLLLLTGFLALIVVLGSAFAVNYFLKPFGSKYTVITKGVTNPVYYVSPTGSDLNNGSASKPWATIQKAANSAVPGTVINVAPGTYTQNIVSKVSGTATANITFTSTTKWGALIRSKGVEVTWENLGDYVNIVGFDISGDGSYGILNRASYVSSIGNLVHDIPATGCTSDGGAGIDNGSNNGVYSGHDNNIIGNVIHDIGPKNVGCNFVHGIYQANDKANIWNNIAYSNSAMGIQTWHAANAINISNNLVFNNGRGGIIVGAGGIPYTVTADNFVVANNISIHNGSYGIYEYGKTGTHNTYTNNLVYANPVNLLFQNGDKAVGTLTVDPQMINYQPDGSGNYQLKSTSPCINAGVPVSGMLNDVNGTLRSQKAGWDIGPYVVTP